MQLAPADVAVIAKACLGDPTPGMSKPDELRFGSHGSKSVALSMGTFFDHERNVGGGILDLIAQARGLKGRDALAFIRGLGIDLPDERSSPAPEPRQEPAQPKRFVCAYDYTDAQGVLQFQAVRYEPKTFSMRVPDGRGGWVNGCPKELREAIPYRLPEALDAVADGAWLFVVEGEKDADRLAKAGIPATCNIGGAGKWSMQMSAALRGARVAVLPDNDEAGEKHAAKVVACFDGLADDVRVVRLPGLGPKQDVSDWLDAGHDPQALYAMVHAAPPAGREAQEELGSGEGSAEPPAGPPAMPEGFGGVMLSGIRKEGLKSDYLIKGLIARGEVSMWAGPSGSGKSFLVTHASLCIARAVDFIAPFGRQPCRVRRGGVVYVASEGAKGLRKRLEAYMRQHDIDGSEVPFVLLTHPLDLHNGDVPTDNLIKLVAQWSAYFLHRFGVPVELVVIDTLAASMPGANENASEHVSKVLDRANRIARECDAAVLLVHHMNAKGDRERGHTSLRANVDALVEVVKTDARDARPGRGRQIRVATLTKNKDGEDGIRWRFVLDSVEIMLDEDGDPVTSCVISLPDMGDFDDRPALEPDRGPRLSEQAMEYLKAVDLALASGGEPPPPGANLPRSLRVVRGVLVRKHFEAITGIAEGEADETKRREAIKKAMQRQGMALLNRDIIGRDNNLGIVWRTGKRAAGEPRHVPSMSPQSPPQVSPESGGYVPEMSPDDVLPMDLLGDPLD